MTTKTQLDRIESQLRALARGKRRTRKIRFEEYPQQWLATRAGEIAQATQAYYRFALRSFGAHAAAAGAAWIHTVDKNHVASWRAARARERSPGTANHGVKAVRALFSSAIRDQPVTANPALGIKPLKAAPTTRDAFTHEQIEQILFVAGAGWQSLVLFGLYTGQRLGDLARLIWSRI